MNDIINNNILKYVHTNNWKEINKYIKNNEIDWDQPIDQTNGLIHYLAYHGKFDLIKHIDPEIFPDLLAQENAEGDTICHIACKLNQTNLFNFIMEARPDIIYFRNKSGFTPLYYLVPNAEFIKKFLKSFEIVDHFLSPEYTLTEYYVMAQNLKMAFYVLDHVKLNEVSKHAMFIVIESQSSLDSRDESDSKLALLEKLIAHDVDPNSLNEKFISPLIIAVKMHDAPVVKFLLESGADPDYSGPENNDNPLAIAIQNHDTALVKLLINSDADPNLSDKYLKTPLHYLFNDAKKFPIGIKRKLLERMENANMADNQMNTILYLLVRNDDWRRYENILEEHKLKIYLQNKESQAPIDEINKKEVNDFIGMVYRSYLNQLDYDIDWVDTVDKKISLMLENGDNLGSFREYIIQKIIGGQSYPIVKNQNMIRMITTPNTNITLFSAYIYNYICFLYYLLAKYPRIKIPSLAPDQMLDKKLNDLYREMTEDFRSDSPDDRIFRSMIRDYISHSPALINHVIIWKNGESYFVSPYIVQGIHETLQKYPDTRFILIKLTIIGEQNFNHANLILFDPVKKIVERFDPYGHVSFIDNLKINHFLYSFFKDYFPEMRYVSPADVCNGVSFQIISDEQNHYVENDPAGFCVAWCIWYAEMRMKNEQIGPRSLVKRTIYQINKTHQTFKDYIRDYANYLDYEKNQIMERVGIPQKYWYRHNLPMAFYKAYLKYVRRMYNEII